MRKKTVKLVVCLAIFAAALIIFHVPVFAAGSTSSNTAGDVATAIEGTWTAAQTQIKSVVNNVIFPVVDMILAILFFVKLGTAYFDYQTDINAWRSNL